MNEHHEFGPAFNDPNWKKLRAPVRPPGWVLKQVEETLQPVYWKSGENHEKDGSYPSGQRSWEMFYRTEVEGDKIVTRLLPGSAQPAQGWLKEGDWPTESGGW